jgi:hypothetical protein
MVRIQSCELSSAITKYLANNVVNGFGGQKLKPARKQAIVAQIL